MGEFSFESDEIHLPVGAWAKTHRRTLRWKGREVLALTQGEFRPYLYPVFTPLGFALTAESPADHPHHQSLWLGADHVHARVPAAEGRVEEYTYGFYSSETFQGRAPGRILDVACAGKEAGPGRFRIEQRIQWRGPVEWAAAEGRLILEEVRTYTIRPGERHHLIDVQSVLSPVQWDVTIGPTRHAFFNFRVAESMRASSGGRLVDDAGRAGGQAISGHGAKWVDASGPVGGGKAAGIALFPRPGGMTWWWFVADWGVVTVGPFRTEVAVVRRGESRTLAARYVVHDGDAASLPLAELYRAYVEEAGS